MYPCSAARIFRWRRHNYCKVLQNPGHCSALTDLERGETFIMPHPLQLIFLILTVLYIRLPQLSRLLRQVTGVTYVLQSPIQLLIMLALA